MKFEGMELREVVNFIRYNLMKEQGITAKELCEKIGVTEASMSRWLNHNRKMPFDVASRSLEVFGYRFVAIRKDWHKNENIPNFVDKGSD